jgi:hypothetical protein
MTVLPDGNLAVMGSTHDTRTPTLGNPELPIAVLPGDDGSEIWRRGYFENTPGDFGARLPWTHARPPSIPRVGSEASCGR